MKRVRHPIDEAKKKSEKARARKRRYWRKHAKTEAIKRLVARRGKSAIILGVADDYTAIAKILAKRRKALGLSQLALDDRAGFQDGYTGKIEIGADRGGRNAGWQTSMTPWLRALGVELVLVHAGPGKRTPKKAGAR